MERLRDMLPGSVPFWIAYTFDDSDELWSHLEEDHNALCIAIAIAEETFEKTFPCLPLDEIAHEKQTRMRYEFYCARRTTGMTQKAVYNPVYLVKLEEKYGK